MLVKPLTSSGLLNQLRCIKTASLRALSTGPKQRRDCCVSICTETCLHSFGNNFFSSHVRQRLPELRCKLVVVQSFIRLDRLLVRTLKMSLTQHERKTICFHKFKVIDRDFLLKVLVRVCLKNGEILNFTGISD